MLDGIGDGWSNYFSLDVLFTARFDGHTWSLAGARNLEVRRVAVAAGEELKRAKKALAA